MKPRLWAVTAAASIAAAIMALAITPAVAQSRHALAHQATAASITLKYGYFGNAAELNAYKQIVALYQKTHPNVRITGEFADPQR